MRTVIGAVTLLAVGTTTASARIGETEAQISARYGRSVGDIPTQAFGKVRGFVAGGYVVGVAFVDGVSYMEMFSKKDQSEMTASEIDTLLKANEGEWKAEGTGKPNWRRWRTQDEALVATYDVGRHFLYINSKKFYEEQGKKIEGGQAEAD
jgi:hypothetical protein